MHLPTGMIAEVRNAKNTSGKLMKLFFFDLDDIRPLLQKVLSIISLWPANVDKICLY